MKFLFLNPGIDTGHSLVAQLKQRGIVSLLAVDVADAWQLLQMHGDSVALGIIHREGVNGEATPGIEFCAKLKGNAGQADLPLIITTEKWTDQQCAEHQNTGSGANAYLHAPFKDEEFFQLVEAVIGALPEAIPEPEEIPEPVAIPEEKNQTELPSVAPAPANEIELCSTLAGVGQQLEDATAVFSADTQNSGEVSIQLAAPIEIASAPQVEVIPQIEMTRQAEVAPQEAVASQEAIAPQEAVAPQMEIVSQTATAPSEPEDKEIATSMPYLFSAAREADKADIQLYNQPVGDAVVPGGAAHTPDLETLKKYLMLREHDVAALSSQFKSAKERIVNIEQLLKVEQARNSELMHTLQTQQDKLDGYDKEKKVEFEVLNDEVKELKFQLKAKNDKVRMFEIKIRDAADETERLKDRVRSDIRKIRVREKELENKLEIIKKDSEALIGSRENKIIELKRKLDLLEFNLDLLQDRYSREKDTSAQLRERLAKAAQVVRLAGGLLDSESSDRLAEMLEDGESAKKAS